MQEEREHIKISLYKNALTGVWLQKQLENRGIKTDKSELSSVLSGSRKGPKAVTIINTAIEVLRDYETAMKLGISQEVKTQ